MKSYSALAMVSLLLVASASCSDDNGFSDTVDGSVAIRSAVAKAAAEGNTGDGADAEDLLANSTFSSTVRITLGSSISADNPLAGNGVSVEQTNGDVVINATVSAVAYELSGTLTGGSVKIYSDKKFKLTLNGVSITNNDGPAINIQSGKRAFVVLADGTTNTLVDGAVYAASSEDQKGTFFSEGQLIFSGNGALHITGNNKHGLVSDDYIRVISGTITVAKAATDGIHSNDGVFIDGGTLNITAGSDGIEAEEGPIIINGGIFTINVADDGIAASWETDDTIDPFVTINGGTFSITTSEGEGIESKSTLTINGGEIYIDAYDDAINASDAIYINDGTVVAYSRTNDGIDSNGTLTVTGGRTLAIGARAPEAGFDCDNNTFKISGGIIVGVGGTTSVPTANASSQASVVLGTGSANTIYSILDADNQEVVTFRSSSAFSTLLLSSGQFATSHSYKLATVSGVNGPTEFHGIYTGGSYDSPSVASTFTLSSRVTVLGGSTGPGGPR